MVLFEWPCTHTNNAVSNECTEVQNPHRQWNLPVLHYLLKCNYTKPVRMTASTCTFFNQHLSFPPPSPPPYMYIDTKHKVSVHDLLNYHEASLPAHDHTYHSCTGTCAWKNYLNSYTQCTCHMWIIYKEQMSTYSMTQKFLTPHLPRKVHWQAQ